MGQVVECGWREAGSAIVKSNPQKTCTIVGPKPLARNAAGKKTYNKRLTHCLAASPDGFFTPKSVAGHPLDVVHDLCLGLSYPVTESLPSSFSELPVARQRCLCMSLMPPVLNAPVPE